MGYGMACDLFNIYLLHHGKFRFFYELAQEACKKEEQMAVITFDQILQVLQVIVLPVVAFIVKMLRDTVVTLKEIQVRQDQCVKERDKLNDAMATHSVVIGRHDVEIQNLKLKNNQ